jgi:protein-S-isoprenylcysteine O-methyltransferase Ste14
MHGWVVLGRGMIGILWVAWVAYWLVAARYTLSNQRTESLLTGASYRVLLVLGAILLAFPDRLGPANPLLWPQSAITVAIALGLAIIGLSIAVWARRHLGKYWSGRITLKVGHHVIQSGPYAFVRHPIYSGILLALLGTVISIGTVRSCIAIALMFVSFVVKLKIEERWLCAHLGAEYEEYRHRVKALIPCVV